MRLRALMVLALSLLCGVLLVFDEAASTTVIPAGLDELSAAANVIFAGTVSKVEYDRIESAGVVTRVTFRDLAFATSPLRERELRMTIRGGHSGTQVSLVQGMPEFQTGKRYIVFADDMGSSRNSYLPVVGLFQGVFRVTQTGGNRVVSDSEGRPVVGVDDGRIDILDPTYNPPVPPSKEQAKKDRIEPPSERGNGVDPNMPVGGAIVDSREYYWPESKRDSVLGSPATVVGKHGRPIKRIFMKSIDPGTRISEDQFLAAVRELSKR